jgi:putative Mg2+ transporter-C (MgtC) family protein
MDGWSDELAAMLRVVYATGLAGAIGWERERAERPAGLRTHMTVGLAACLITVLAQHIAVNHPAADDFRTDPTRVLEAVVTGVSFLGAGTIFAQRGGRGVHGLTTAASLLATAVIGVAAGLDAWMLAASATALLLIVLRLLARLQPLAHEA